MRACKNPRAVHYVRAMKGKIRSALILCAGYGSRLRPLTDRLPKPLLPAGGRPALFAAIDKLRSAGIRDFFVNVHHLPEKFAEAFGLPAGIFADSRAAEARYGDCRVRLVCEPEILDTGGAVKNLLPLLDLSGPLAVHNGDIIFSSPAEGFLAEAEANLADKNCAATLCLRSSGNLPNVGVGGSGDVGDMRFALGAPFERLAQYAGFFVLNPPAFKFFAGRAEDKFSIVDAFLDILRSGGRIAGVFDDAGEWADIGTLSEYARLGAGGTPDGWTALARLCVAGFPPDKGEIIPVSKGASSRKFYRFARGGERLVACFYAENPRENFLYAPLAEFLRCRGIPVPEVKFHDPQSRMIVMRDAGARDLGAVHPSEGRKFYFEALRAAKKVHSISSGEFARAGIELCPPFDGALYAWEQNYFFEECARGVFGIGLPRPEEDFGTLSRELSGFPQSPLLRDFQSQNVMVSEAGTISLIDFQGMRFGNPLYDMASLLFDPYVEPFGEEFIDAALREYLSFTPRADFPDFAESKRMLNFAAVERLLQALGAYGFLSRKKGMAEYGKYFEPAAKNLLRRARLCGLEGVGEFGEAILKKLRK